MIENPTKGFLSVLGPWPVHYAMLLTFITTVSFPRVEEGKHLIIHWIWIMHLVLASVGFLSNYDILGVYNHLVLAVSMLLYAFSLILMFTSFIPFPNEVVDQESEDAQLGVEDDLEEVADDVNLTFWLKFEVLVFCANLVANVVFLLIRGFGVNRIGFPDKSFLRQGSNDGIEKQNQLVSLVGSLLIPFIATTCILQFEWAEIEDIDTISSIGLSSFQIVQLIQSLAILILAFVPLRGSGGPNSCHTRCMPVLSYALTIALFTVIPLLVLIGYVAVSMSSKEEGPVFVYLTFYTLLSVLIEIQFLVSFLDVFENVKNEHASVKMADRETYDKRRGTLLADDKPGQRLGQPVPLGQNIYSLMFVSMVKPEYSKYCQLVESTGQKMPIDADEPMSATNKQEILVTRGVKDSWCSKLKSFFCCRLSSKTSDLAAVEDTDREDGGSNTNINPDINTIRTIQTKDEQIAACGWSVKQLSLDDAEASRRFSHQSEMLGLTILLATTQVFSTVALLSTLSDFDWTVRCSSAPVVATRFICGLVLHLYLQKDIVQGFSNIKYSLNHPWKFERPGLACLSGLLQVCVVLTIEGVNFIMLLTKTTHLEIVLNLLILVIVSQFDDFFYQAFVDQSSKQILQQASEAFQDFLKIQVTSSSRLILPEDKQEIHRQSVETIPPLANELQISPKIIVEWKERKSCSNKCFAIVYRVFRKLFTSVWFYYIPFIALAANFLAPYKAALDAPPPSTMDDSYLDFLSQVLSNDTAVRNYTEPSVDELVELMTAQPLINDNMEILIDILVVPLSLEQYWDAFWADEAPYFVGAINRDPRDIFNNATTWGPPSPDYSFQFGKPVLQERRKDQDNKMDLIFLPAYCGALYVYSLLEKNETMISVKITEMDYGCGAEDQFHQETVWEVITPDPASRQTVHRMQFNIKWFKKPFYGGSLEKGVKKDITKLNKKYTKFFKNSAIKFLGGEPYEDPLLVDGVYSEI